MCPDIKVKYIKAEELNNLFDTESNLSEELKPGDKVVHAKSQIVARYACPITIVSVEKDEAICIDEEGNKERYPIKELYHYKRPEVKEEKGIINKVFKKRK